MKTLDNLPEFEAALDEFQSRLVATPASRSPGLPTVIGVLYCTSCGDSRRMEAIVLHPQYIEATPYNTIPTNLGKQRIVLCQLRCLQCDTCYAALKYPGPDGPALIVMSSTRGGLSTPNTVPAVAYYLDQGHK